MSRRKRTVILGGASLVVSIGIVALHSSSDDSFTDFDPQECQIESAGLPVVPSEDDVHNYANWLRTEADVFYYVAFSTPLLPADYTLQQVQDLCFNKGYDAGIFEHDGIRTMSYRPENGLVYALHPTSLSTESPHLFYIDRDIDGIVDSIYTDNGQECRGYEAHALPLFLFATKSDIVTIFNSSAIPFAEQATYALGLGDFVSCRSTWEYKCVE